MPYWVLGSGDVVRVKWLSSVEMLGLSDYYDHLNAKELMSLWRVPDMDIEEFIKIGLLCGLMFQMLLAGGEASGESEVQVHFIGFCFSGFQR